MDWLFGQLHGLFGNKLLDAWRSGHAVDGKDTGIENMKVVWTEKIRANGLKLADVKRGIEGCERLKWAPTWAEFLELCTPALNVDAALYEAIEQMRARRNGRDIWSHPAIYWAAVKVGEWDMLSSTFAQLRPRYESALRAVERTQLHPVPARAPALAAPGTSETSREHARRRLAELNASGVLEGMHRSRGIEWAIAIVDDHRNGVVTPASKLAIARDAIFNVTGQRPS